MKGINKIFRSRYAWIFFLVVLIVAIYVSASLRYRIDLTAEKRFSLNESTRKLLQGLDSTVDVTVFLTGDLPADYKKLSIAARDLLSEFRDISQNRVIFRFEKPGENLIPGTTSISFLLLALSSKLIKDNYEIPVYNAACKKQLG